MNSIEYWRRREEEQLRRNITEEAEYEKQVRKIYDRMMADIQKEIDAFYGKYAEKEGISMAAAKRRVAQLDIDAYAAKAKKYVAEKNLSKRANEEMRIYNLTMKVNRLEMLKAEIGIHLVDGFTDLDQYVSETLNGRTTDELKRQAGILGKTVSGNDTLVHSIVNASFHNATFSDRIWMHQAILKSELDKQIQQGLIAGKHPQVLARDIRKAFNVSRSDAERLMRTELARVQTDAQMRSFEENGFEWYMFLSLGSRACEVCRALNGKKFKVKDMLISENAPPMHPNCRCSTAAAMGDEEIAEIRGGEKTGSRHINYAKAIDNVSVNDSFGTPGFTKEELLNEAQKTSVGRNVIKALENDEVGVVISSNFDPLEPNARGRQDDNVLYLFASNIISVKEAAKTMIHEYTHYRYNIGNCQHAEAICFAYEKMHNENREFLYDDEWEYVKGLAIYAYPAYNWEQGGYGDYEQFDFVRSRNKKG